MKNPLQQNSPIPWKEIKALDMLRHVWVQDPINASPGPSMKRTLEDTGLFRSSTTGNVASDKKKRRRNVVEEKMRYIEIDDDSNNGEAMVRMEEMDVDVRIDQ